VEQIDLASVLHDLGNVLLKVGDTSEAMNTYNEALSLRHNLCGIGVGVFATLVQQSDLDNTIHKHHDILKDTADTLHNIGGIYETMKKEKKALNCYNQALIIKRSISRDKPVGFL
jgi:tetratricopeptide (TPR) repeat protein